MELWPKNFVSGHSYKAGKKILVFQAAFSYLEIQGY